MLNYLKCIVELILIVFLGIGLVIRLIIVNSLVMFLSIMLLPVLIVLAIPLVVYYRKDKNFTVLDGAWKVNKQYFKFNVNFNIDKNKNI
jgi:hypothetical protein